MIGRSECECNTYEHLIGYEPTYKARQSLSHFIIKTQFVIFWVRIESKLTIV